MGWQFFTGFNPPQINSTTSDFWKFEESMVRNWVNVVSMYKDQFIIAHDLKLVEKFIYEHIL